MLRLFLIVFLFPTAAAAQAVALVPYSELERQLSERIDFENFPARLSPGLNHDAPLLYEGAAIGERFAGQGNTDDEGFDNLSGQPAPGLVVLPGDTGRNLAVTHIFMQTNQLQGLGTIGFPERDAGGEGAVALQFEQDQSRLGFKVAAELRPDEPAPKGIMTVTFFTRQGTVIDRLDVPLDWGRHGYGFARAGEAVDIGGITIENRDPGGIAIDDIIFNLIRAGT